MATASACERARERLIDLRLADASEVDREAHRDAMKRALGDSFVSGCTSSMTTAQVRCVLSAADSVSAATCVPSSNRQ